LLSSKSAPGISGMKGVFFSTFFGGHETSWGPKKEVHTYFSNFKVGTTRLEP
jgi:Polysaccharide lyase 14